MKVKDMKALASLLRAIDEVKLLSLKVNLYDNLDIDEKSRLSKEAIALPSAQEFMEPDSFDALLAVTKDYLAIISDSAKSHLEPYSPDEFTYKFYNEIDLYEAKPFADALNELLKGYEQGNFYVDIYDTGTSVQFVNRKKADRFMKEYTHPCTLFYVNKNNEVVELASI